MTLPAITALEPDPRRPGTLRVELDGAPVYLRQAPIRVEMSGLGKFLLSSKLKIQSINLHKYFIQQPFQLSLVPGLGTQPISVAQLGALAWK